MNKYIMVIACFVIAIITLDPLGYILSVPLKHHMFIVFAPLLLLLIAWQAKKWTFGLIPALFLIRMIWLAATNPEWVVHPGNDGFYLYVCLMLILFALSLYKFSNYTYSFFWTLFCIGIAETIIGVWQLYTYIPNPTVPLKTAMLGTLGTSNGLGLLLVLSFIAGSILLKVTFKKQFKALLVFGLLFNFLGILLTESRGAALALLTAGCVMGSIFLFTTENNFTRIVTKYHITAILALIVLTVGIGYGLFSIDRASSVGRLMIWEISWDMFQAQPIIGVGHGNYAVEYLNYQGQFLSEPEHVHFQDKAANIKQAHNEFFQAFAEGGIVGGILFLFIWLLPLYYGLKSLFKSEQKNWRLVGIVGIHVAIVSHSLVDSPLHVFPVTLIAYINLMMIPMPEWSKNVSSFWKKVLIIALIVFTVFMSFRAKRLYSARYEWQQGLWFANQLEWKSAISHYRQALNRFGKQGELEHYLGAAMVFDGQYTRGIYYLNQAKKDFNDRNIYLMESYANLQLKKYEEAERLSKKALKMFPDHLAPHLLLGEIYYSMEKYDLSKASLKKCIHMDTKINSQEVRQISRDAKIFWNRNYDNFEY